MIPINKHNWEIIKNYSCKMSNFCSFSLTQSQQFIDFDGTCISSGEIMQLHLLFPESNKNLDPPHVLRAGVI